MKHTRTATVNRWSIQNTDQTPEFEVHGGMCTSSSRLGDEPARTGGSDEGRHGSTRNYTNWAWVALSISGSQAEHSPGETATLRRSPSAKQPRSPSPRSPLPTPLPYNTTLSINTITLTHNFDRIPSEKRCSLVPGHKTRQQLSHTSTGKTGSHKRADDDSPAA